jgi:hypothetical protein
MLQDSVLGEKKFPMLIDPYNDPFSARQVEVNKEIVKASAEAKLKH